MLCAACISIFQGPAKEGNHHASFQDLLMAANSGCKICKSLCRFREDLGPDEAGELNTNPFSRFRYVKFEDKAPYIEFVAEVSWMNDDLPYKHVELHISDPMVTPGWWSQFLEVVNEDLRTEPWHVRDDNFPRRSIPTNTGDAGVLRLGLDWLEACKSNHNECQMMGQTPDCKYYPRRLLDIGDTDSEVCHLVVIENGQQTDGSGYVALSHCWGKNPCFLTLTSNNMDDLQRGMPIYCLPKSFVDSIHICRQLGFRYLWIDSLCIIQSGPGSEEDWQAHAATMDSIYANCELNLALACASNAEQGAFVDRDSEFLQTAFVHVPITMNLHDITEIHLPSQTGSNDVAARGTTVRNDDFTMEVESSSLESMSSLVTIFVGMYDFQSAIWSLPLQKRGWVVQERLMAPRVLHFGQDRIYWECKEKVQNEYLPWGIEGSGIMFDEHYQTTFSLPDSTLESSPYRLNNQVNPCEHAGWHRVIAEYSETELTYPNKDKLVAIAAVAKKFNRVFSSQYIAGIFRSDLPLGLLWIQGLEVCQLSKWEGNGWEDGWWEKISFDRQRDSTYRAPSWSWANEDHPVHFGQVHGAYGISGPWQKSRKILSTVVNVCVDLVDQCNPYGQLSSAEITIEGPVSIINPLDKGYKWWRNGWGGSPEKYDDTDQLFALHIIEIESLEDDDNVISRVYGLALRLVGIDTYRRIGLYRCRGPRESRYPASNFKRAAVKLV